MTQRIAKLEALLARIKANAAAGRAARAPVVAAAAQEAIFEERPEDQTDITSHVQVVTEEHEETREVEVPLESRARLVAAPATSGEVEEIEAEDVLELDERHVVPDALATTLEHKAVEEPASEDEGPPPSSRRPIAEPAETPQEAQIKVAHTPPPESGKQVAADALSFDDDFTGVREAQPTKIVPAPEASIQLQSMRSPAVQEPAPVDEMEVDLGKPADATRPPPGPLPNQQPPRTPSVPEPSSTLTFDAPASAEITRPTRPVAASQVAEMTRAANVEAPKTFGELIDLALSL